MTRAAAVVVLALVSSACGVHVHLVPARVCQDGLPSRVLVDVACRDGICGITCAPNRWKE